MLFIYFYPSTNTLFWYFSFFSPIESCS